MIILYMVFNPGRANTKYLIKRPTFEAVRYPSTYILHKICTHQFCQEEPHLVDVQDAIIYDSGPRC